MNFKTIKFKLNSGEISSTLVAENKVSAVLEKLNTKTEAWVE